jgi:two-component system cell cycle response regulator CpdR
MAKILLAEDDDAMRQFLTLALEKAGHTVVGASDGAEAFRLFQESEGAFDLLLTDIVMPGMDGIELSQKARQKAPGIKIMFITGFAAIAPDAQSGLSGAEAPVVSKPFHLGALVEQVNGLLESGQK